MTNDSGKSDKPIVPQKDANKRRGGPRQAERLEERGLAKGNSGEQTKFWTQGQVDLHDGLALRPVLHYPFLMRVLDCDGGDVRWGLPVAADGLTLDRAIECRRYGDRRLRGLHQLK